MVASERYIQLSLGLHEGVLTSGYLTKTKMTTAVEFNILREVLVR